MPERVCVDGCRIPEPRESARCCLEEPEVLLREIVIGGFFAREELAVYRSDLASKGLFFALAIKDLSAPCLPEFTGPVTT